MTEQEVKELLIKTNAIMEGHFLLTSGLHSPMYVEKFNVLQQPKYTEQLCKALAEYFADKNIDTVRIYKIRGSGEVKLFGVSPKIEDEEVIVL